MSIGMSAWLEVVGPGPARDDPWVGVASLGYVLADGTVAYAAVFPLIAAAEFVPIVPERGLPPALSEEVRKASERARDYADGFFGATWATWQELKGMDWDEESPSLFGPVFQHTRLPDGSLTDGKAAAWDYNTNRWFAFETEQGAAEAPWLRVKEEEWEADGHVYRLRHLRRADVLGKNWQAVFTMMGALAELYGESGIRLVVWFHW
jgi:hypothetical protein